VKQPSLNPLRLFNSVIFGISIMVLVAAYIAIGSGCASVREYFEMDELQFFNAWPLKALMALLVINLVVVTWNRIPLTPPRYGVWCVHAGIVTLILATSFYYRNKIEGTTRLYTSPEFGPVSTDHFYDKDQRALYLKIDGTMWNWYALPSLPRFKAYDATLGNAAALDRDDLRKIEPYIEVQDDKSKPPIRRSLSQTLGWKDELRLAVVGYYPFANVNTSFAQDPAGDLAGLRVSLPDMHEGENFETWLVGADARHRFTSLEGTDLEHRWVDAATLSILKQSIDKIFRLDVTVGGATQTIYVQPGRSYPVGQSGYKIDVENFNPAWPMFGTREIVQALTLKVTTPTQTFRRMVLHGRDLQTDFKLGDNDPSVGPMGKRQKEPLDKDLLIRFKFTDPAGLLPRDGTIKHTLLTGGDERGITDIVAGLSTPGEVRTFDNGVGDVALTPADPMANAPFAKMAAAADQPPADQQPPHPAIKLHLERVDHLRRDDAVQIVPPARRTRDAGESGQFQVLRVRVTLGDWSRDVVVPYSLDAGDISWDGGSIKLPTGSTLQLALGQVKLPLPARLTLAKFEVVPYPGGDTSTRSMMLDFRSTLKVEDIDSGESATEIAHMNSPVYFGDGSWLFFQAAYDGEEHHWTILGVGNRPGVRVMILGCCMIVAGVLYAFYAKPYIIRRMKANAIAKANALKAAKAAAPKPVELVNS